MGQGNSTCEGQGFAYSALCHCSVYLRYLGARCSKAHWLGVPTVAMLSFALSVHVPDRGHRRVPHTARAGVQWYSTSGAAAVGCFPPIR